MTGAPKAKPAAEPDFPPLPPGCCAVCRQPETGAGYAPPGKRRKLEHVVWTCSAHIDLAKTVFHMPPADFNRLEWTALREAGAAMGEYLDGLGKTDLAALSAEEFETATATLIWAYGESMAKQLRAAAAPF